MLPLPKGASQGVGDKSKKPGGVLHAGQVLRTYCAGGGCDQLGPAGVLCEGNFAVQLLPRSTCKVSPRTIRVRPGRSYFCPSQQGSRGLSSTLGKALHRRESRLEILHCTVVAGGSSLPLVQVLFGCCVLASRSVTLAGAPVTLLCCLVLSVVLPCVVQVQRRDSVRHSTRRQSRLQCGREAGETRRSQHGP